MSTAAERHPHLSVVPSMPAQPPAPVEGVVVEKTKAVEKAALPSWLGAAVNHAKDNNYYAPLARRGWGRIAHDWMDRYHDDYPHLIDSTRKALREAPADKHAELKKAVRDRRAEYLQHRLTRAGVTGAWAAAGGVSLTAATATGAFWVDLAAGLGAYLYGMWRGVGSEPIDNVSVPVSAGSAQQPVLTQTSDAQQPALTQPSSPAVGPADEEALLSALVKADIITAAERQETRVVGGVRRDGPGWAASIELPEGMPALRATSKVNNLAGALRKKVSQLEFKPDTSETGHEGMVTLWVADEPNPHAGPKVYSELINAPRWHFWRDGIPLGMDARQARQVLRLIWSSIMIGGLQDYGKSYLARLIAAAAALDPTVRIIVITGKKGPDWTPLKKIAHRFIAGSDPDTIREAFVAMTEVIDDMQARGEELDRLFDKEPHRVPEGKITPELADDGMGPVLLIVEELQELLGGAAITKMPVPDDDSEKPRLVSAKPLLVDLFARFNRVARFVLGMGLYITQRPDASGVPTELRDVCVKRACFRTKTRESSEMVLGEMAVAAGASPHALLESSKGVLVLDEGAEDGYRTLRGDVIDLPDFVKISERGLELRLAKGTLSGDALQRYQEQQAAQEAGLTVEAALRVMDDLKVVRMRTETLAAALHLTVDELKVKMRAAGVPDPTPIGAIDGLVNPRGYKRETLASA
ncbi:hypothetical protein ACFWJT_15820 [Streptomyces sp. NPDC127069]|uniref:hypothetical protein n=1 Tax=Streptomyces sp. NPDC127069 TaxID=3347128 RepID=UPI0036625330